MSAPSDAILVAGAGASALVVALVGAEPQRRIVALDISSAALDQLREQLGPAAERVEYLVADVREVELAEPVAVWHDRAVFHFLTDAADQAAYVDRVAAAVRPGGHVLIATFAEDGPTQCSGLPVARHSAASLAGVFGARFDLLDHFEHNHLTPWASEQRFTHAVFRRR